jgi:hypothetical protein
MILAMYELERRAQANQPMRHRKSPLRNEGIQGTKIGGRNFSGDERNGILNYRLRSASVYRWHESSLGSVVEHANLLSDGKRKGTRVKIQGRNSDALNRGGIGRNDS